MNSAFYRHLKMSQLGFVLICLAGGSACSDVQLNYQLPAAVTQLNGADATLSVQGADRTLANLRLNTTLAIDPAVLAKLRLQFVLENANGVLQEITVSATQFLEDPELFWEQLPLGEADLKVRLLDAQDREVGQLTEPLNLQPDQEQRLHFALSPGLNGEDADVLHLRLSAGSQDDAFNPLQETQLKLAFPVGTPPTDVSDTDSGVPSAPLVQGSTDSGTVVDHLNLRLVESGQNSLSFVWEAPEDQEVDHYRLFLDGELISSAYLQRNHRVTGLFSNQEYTFSVQPVLKDGTLLPAVPLAATTGQGTGGGSGGGGGGGGGSAPNNPPVITALTPTTTTLSAPGYPVGLTAAATDETVLPDSAYTWSCTACGDASFHTSTGTAASTTGKDVVWNAPSTPGTYTLTLSVSDGVNPPVTQTQEIIVNQRQGTVIVEGSYR